MTYKGRDRSFPHVSRLVTAQKHMDINLCGSTNAQMLMIRNSLKKFAANYKPDAVEGFDVTTALPLL